MQCVSAATAYPAHCRKSVSNCQVCAALRDFSRVRAAVYMFSAGSAPAPGVLPICPSGWRRRIAAAPERARQGIRPALSRHTFLCSSYQVPALSQAYAAPLGYPVLALSSLQRYLSASPSPLLRSPAQARQRAAARCSDYSDRIFEPPLVSAVRARLRRFQARRSPFPCPQLRLGH